MGAGRPTKYDEDILKSTQAYIDSCTDSIELIGASIERKVNIPSVEGLAYYLKVARSTIYKWAESHPEFSDIIEDLLANQAQKLINNGLSGAYSSTIAKVILTKHGYSDKHQVEEKSDSTIRIVRE